MVISFKKSFFICKSLFVSNKLTLNANKGCPYNFWPYYSMEFCDFCGKKIVIEEQ